MSAPVSMTKGSDRTRSVVRFCATTSQPATTLKQAENGQIARSVSTGFFGTDPYHSGDIVYGWDGGSIMCFRCMYGLAQILEIERLQDNWNDNGASRFSQKILAAAKAIVMGLAVQPSIFPTARDSIQFEYENELGDYLEFELFENGLLKKFFCSHTGDTETDYISADTMNEVVNKFYGRNV